MSFLGPQKNKLNQNRPICSGKIATMVIIQASLIPEKRKRKNNS
jgi:hypothetical protein